jgi:hypothetical protein
VPPLPIELRIESFERTNATDHPLYGRIIQMEDPAQVIEYQQLLDESIRSKVASAAAILAACQPCESTPMTATVQPPEPTQTPLIAGVDFAWPNAYDNTPTTPINPTALAIRQYLDWWAKAICFIVAAAIITFQAGRILRGSIEDLLQHSRQQINHWHQSSLGQAAHSLYQQGMDRFFSKELSEAEELTYAPPADDR